MDLEETYDCVMCNKVFTDHSAFTRHLENLCQDDVESDGDENVSPKQTHSDKELTEPAPTGDLIWQPKSLKGESGSSAYVGMEQDKASSDLNEDSNDSLPSFTSFKDLKLKISFNGSQNKPTSR